MRDKQEQHNYNIKWNRENKELKAKLNRDWYNRTSEERKKYAKEYRKNNLDRLKRLRREHYQIHKHEEKQIRINNKIKVFNHYCDNDIRCVCCGERRHQLLSIDHINNDGAEHRRRMNVNGYNLIIWIINNNFPKDYQVLCMNCNWSKGKELDHICVHKKEINDCVFDYQVVA